MDRTAISETLRDWTECPASVTPFTTGRGWRGADAVGVSTDDDRLAVHPTGQPPIIPNGTFAAIEHSSSTDGWTANTGWAIGSGVATATLASTALTYTTAEVKGRRIAIIPGMDYLLVFTMTRSAGSVQASIGGTNGTSRSTADTFSEVIAAGSSDLTVKFTGTGFSGTIDNVYLFPLTHPMNANGFYGYAVDTVAAVIQSTTVVTNSPAMVGWYDKRA